MVPSGDEFIKNKENYFRANAFILYLTLGSRKRSNTNAYFDALDAPRSELQKVILEILAAS